MKYCYYLLAILSVSASVESYAQAKSHAEQIEIALSAKERERLTHAQGQLDALAFP